MPQLAIIADDLTGAADTGACFAAVGVDTVILLSNAAPPAAAVVVRSTESRGVGAREAARRVDAAIARLTGPQEDSKPRWFYKKMDSTLRGHPRPELLSLMAVVGASQAIVAPALPAESRTTVGGRQYIHGVPLEASPVAGAGAVSNLLTLFQNTRGVPVRLLDLETVRSGPEAIQRRLGNAPTGIVVADAETDADLLGLSRAVSGTSVRILCGTAGFARQLAHTLPLTRSVTPALDLGRGASPILVVAGSRHAATARQIDTLRRMGVPILSPDQALLDDPAAPTDAIVTELARHLARGSATVLTTAGLAPSPLGPQSVVARLAQIIAAPDVRDRIDGLVLTGGAVAAGVCAALGTSAVRLAGNIAPGLPWGVLEEGVLSGAPVATKAGSFGGDDALLACIDHLAAGARSSGAR